MAIQGLLMYKKFILLLKYQQPLRRFLAIF